MDTTGAHGHEGDSPAAHSNNVMEHDAQGVGGHVTEYEDVEGQVTHYEDVEVNHADSGHNNYEHPDPVESRQAAQRPPNVYDAL